MVWIMVVTDVCATSLALYDLRSSTVFSLDIPFPSPSPLLATSPALLFSAITVIAANYLRQRCFRELACMFTFEVTIQPNHKLVTTGPYAFARHPSYAGVYLTLLGSTVVGLAPGSWLRECWLGGTTKGLPWAIEVVVSLLVAFWFAKLVFVFKNTYRRVQLEDDELHKKFGQRWERYAQRVKWKLVPFVL